jgi:hypothetical protein
VFKHLAELRELEGKSLILRNAPGRARTCNPMIRSHILYPSMGLMVGPPVTAERNLTLLEA